ncbi:MAG: exopolysaccharide biosynthesis protein, partial [Rubrobacteraceae bacterium]
VLGGVLLMAPFGFVPFSNTLPGLAILFLAIGMLQRDGVFVAFGYIAIVATIVYFAALIAAAVAAGMGLRSIFLTS